MLTTLLFCAVLAARAQADSFPAGTPVQFDRVEASKPELGRWDRGVVVRLDAYGRYVIKGDNGNTYTIRNDPRWILPANAPRPGPNWDGSTGAPTSTAQPLQGHAPAATPPAAVSGKWAPGMRVQFDRAEGSKPEYGRWDSGVVEGKDRFGRVQIRGDNGILYSIHDDPRWIIAAGAPLPGPKHDAYEVHVPPPGQPAAAPGAAPTNGASPAPGHYICSSFSEQILGMAFTLTGPTSYTFDAGGSGTLRIDAGTGQASFSGPIGEVMRDDQLTAIVKVGGGRNEFAFVGNTGTAVMSCHREK
jgi:hypothetical protein